MSNLSDKYSEILNDIEKHISNSDEKNYVTKKIDELSSIYMELIDRVSKIDNERIEALEDKQEKMIKTITDLKNTVDLIKNDIYEEDGYDFEIVCPYCNHEFVADVESELKEEVECPECHNIIELNWDEEETGCSRCHGGSCSSCQSNNNQDNTDENSENSNNEEDDM